MAIRCFVLCLSGAAALLLVSPRPLAAQSPGANPVSQSVRDLWEEAKRNLIGSTKVMPEDKYGFRPVATVRTYGEILAHLAGANFVFCAAARGEKSPRAEDEFEKSAKTRAQIVKAVEDSISYCETAYRALTDRTAAEMIEAPFGGAKTARVAALMGNTGHIQEHYGNLVTYLRINGLVPPSSARQP
jgi:DinB superfamily